MEILYNLITVYDSNKRLSSIVGLKNSELFSMHISQESINNQIHQFLKKGFKFCDIQTNETPLDALFDRGRIYSEKVNNKKDYKLVEILNKPGKFYPRIYRPIISEKDSGLLFPSIEIRNIKNGIHNQINYNPNSTALIVSALNQLSILTNRLKEILHIVYPSNSNIDTYGHEIKNLLVLACIEVEAQLKGIYKANEVSSKNNYSTKDYIKLKKIMKLDKYSVTLPLYPNLKSFSPFKNWCENQGTTKSIKWYDDYNAVKHNSETEFSKATLESAINAVCAIVILLKAQYGEDILYWKEIIGNYYITFSEIDWVLSEMYMPPLESENWSKQKLI